MQNNPFMPLPTSSNNVTFVPLSGVDGVVVSGSSDTPGKQPVHEAVSLAQSLAAELDEIRAEAMGWIPLDNGAYLHPGVASKSDDDIVIQVVGVPDIQMAAMNLLLLV